MDITKKAMLVRLSVSQWSARRLDQAASREVIESHGAVPDSGRFNKLLVDLAAVKRYQKASSEARVYHYAQTLPWGDDDSRILPASNYLNYTSRMREFRAAFEAAVAEFIGEYPALIGRASRDLNGLFKASDYPAADDLKDKFAFSVSVDPVPAADDFRVSLSEDEAAVVRADIEARVRVSINEAMADAWGRMFRAVKHLSDRLHDSDAIFRDSLIGNIKELCDVLPRLNLTDDPALAAVIGEAQASLASLDPDSLRKRPLDRAAAARDADAILSKMAGYCGE